MVAVPVLAAAEETVPEVVTGDDLVAAERFAELDAEARAATGTLTFVLENDVFNGSDAHYTNGVRLSWITGPQTTPRAALAAARYFPLFREGGAVRTSYAIGQNMYTSSDINVANPALTERPYAGWLYGSMGLISESGDQLDELELTIGIVGPASLAGRTQKIVHEIIDSPNPKGWDTQLHNEPGVILAYQRSWRRLHAESLGGFGFDLTPHLGGAIGNIYTYAGAGLTLRVGAQLPLDYGPPRIRPAPGGSDFFVPRQGFGWYLFAGVEGRVVARNIFLDGNTFRDSRSVDKEIFVGDLQFGAAVTWNDIRLAYTHVLRSREFKTQGGTDDFGAISMSVRF